MSSADGIFHISISISTISGGSGGGCGETDIGRRHTSTTSMYSPSLFLTRMQPQHRHVVILLGRCGSWLNASHCILSTSIQSSSWIGGGVGVGVLCTKVPLLEFFPKPLTLTKVIIRDLGHKYKPLFTTNKSSINFNLHENPSRQ